ncbi:MAG: winged helix-turn-helix transcriptional regulator [Candidatus Omnitrophota bacterium]
MFKGWTAYYKRKPKVEGDFDYYKITFYLEKKEVYKKPVKIGSEIGSEKVLSLIRGNPSISAQEMADKIGISSRAIEKRISKLKANKIIKRIGPAKGGHWEVL